MSDVFLAGPLAETDLLRVVLGQAGGEGRPARLPGWRFCRPEAGPVPGMARSDSAVLDGIVLSCPPGLLARIAFFAEGAFGWHPTQLHLETGKEVTAFVPRDPALALDAALAADDWRLRAGPGMRHAAVEAMSYFGRIGASNLAGRMPTILQRAYSRARAEEEPAPHSLRSSATVAEGVQVIEARRPYVHFFALEEHDLRFRRFDGSFSDVVNRAGFVGGDAVTVLPYDPVSDQVLLIEQFRIGPYMRGDRQPWLLEPIAGRVDPGESLEDCARREAQEEAGITLGGLHHVSGYYPSPGAVSEFVISYVAEADLVAHDGGQIGGLDIENEDIRAHILSFDRMMELLTTGEINVGPLVISALWLARNRDRLRGEPA